MTDQTDPETMLERRLVADAATGVRPIVADDIARSTMASTTAPVGRVATLRGPRRPARLAALGLVVLLASVVGAAILGGRPPAIQGVFVDGPSLVEDRFLSALAMPDGRVLVGVGPGDGSVIGQRTLLLEPRTGELTPTSTPPPGLAVTSMALLRDGRVLFVAGSVSGPGATVYDLLADRFEVIAEPISSRAMPFLVTLSDGRVLVGGGDTEAGAVAEMEMFDPVSGTFRPTGPMTRRRGFGLSGVLLPDGRVLVAGGSPELGASAELFDPASGTWSLTGEMTVARGGFFSSTLLDDGRVLLAGGFVPVAGDPTAFPSTTATAEIYDPATGRFTAVGPMAAPRLLHAASILSDGTVLVAGGADAIPPEGMPVVTDTAEVFDPSTDTLRPTGSLHRGRLLPAAVAADDRVLLLGHMDPTQEEGDEARATSEWFE